MEVRFAQAEKMNLLGYFLRDILKNNLTSERREEVARSLSGGVLIRASGMEATLQFREDVIEIHQGETQPISSTVTGDLNALLEVAMGANYLGFLIKARIRVRGNLFQLIKLIKLLQVVKPNQDTA